MSLLHAEVHLAELSFAEAFERWIGMRIVNASVAGGGGLHDVRYLSAETERTYREYAWALDIFFRKLPLREIHDGHVRTYQAKRAACAGAWVREAGQNRIGQEVKLLLRILRSAGVWGEDLEEAFDPLPHVDSDKQRVLEPEQQVHLLKVMRTREEWFWIHDYAVVALQTCSDTHELRQIRLGDINYRSSTLRIGPESSKNKFRNRTIPLETPEVREALQGLELRARKFGAEHGSHFLMPFGAGKQRRGFSVLKPMSKWGLKLPWTKIREHAGLPWLRPYDLRHTAITRMAERGVPIATIMSFAGHISLRMQQHYTTISMEAKRAAAASVWSDMPGSSGGGLPPKKPVTRALPTPIELGRRISVPALMR